MIEIERKFLIKNDDYKSEAYAKKTLRQGYISTDPKRTVRIRIEDDKAFITIKGESSSDGLQRFEFEQEIGLEDAENLLNICLPGKISKYRHLVKVENMKFEVDEFLDENTGLTVAEIELENVDQQFCKPSWLGEEVTGDTKYYNAQLSKNPFKDWND